MNLAHGLHLAYCTNIHRGETWAETLAALQMHTLAVRDRVGRDRPYGIGLRLSARAARELADAATLKAFQRWLDREHCYVFTINGFPYGRFHGTRVKEQVFVPDWTSAARLDYTIQLFELLAKLVPQGVEGSVSTVPGSFKEFITGAGQERTMRENLWRCVEQVARLSERTGRVLHLGLEPEPLGYLETSAETVAFIERMRAERPGDERLDAHLGVTYDTCHLAVEFEEPAEVLQRFRVHRIKLSKLHLSAALKVCPSPAAREALRAFAEDTYLHQVVARTAEGGIVRFRDLEAALRSRAGTAPAGTEEWRIHFHVPLHSPPAAWFETTADHLLGVLDAVARQPELCSHLEMETYTWAVLPPELKARQVVDQLVAEYDWCLARLRERGLAPAAMAAARSGRVL